MKKLIMTLILLGILALGGLWAYGFLGVKCGWVGPMDISKLNPISQKGANAAGGVMAATETTLGL